MMDDRQRAEELNRAIERLLRGEPVSDTDPLINEARKLLALPVDPRAQAVTRFNAQVDRWFRPVPARPMYRSRTVWGGLLAIGATALILFGIVSVQPQFVTAPATPTLIYHTQTTTSTVSPTPTGTETTESLISSITPVTGTPVPNSIVISGLIESVASSQIVVEGQQVTVTGGTSGLCVGDQVRLTPTVRTNGTLFVSRSGIVRLISGCPTVTNPGYFATLTPTPTTGSGGGNYTPGPTSVVPTVLPSPGGETPESHQTPEATEAPVGTRHPDN